MRFTNVKALFVALFLTVISATISVAGEGQLTPEQQARLKGSERHQQDGWTIVHIQGDPGIRGFQYGYLMAKEIAESIHAQRVEWTYRTGLEWSWLLDSSKQFFSPNVVGECLEEIDGIVEGMRAAGVATTRNEMIAYNGYIELMWYWWPEKKKEMESLAPEPRKESCSSFIATGSMTANGGIVLGHNTMSSYISADSYVILDVAPSRGHRILMQTSPGWIHSGTDFFITDAGIVGSETTLGRFKGFAEKGVPEFVRMRRATQEASSIDQWCDIMKEGNNGGYANAWLIGDVNTNEIARLELGLRYIGFERTKNGYFTGSNIAENVKILRFETEENETDIRISGVARRVRWKELMKQYAGKITVETAKGFEADHYDPYLHAIHPGSRTLCAHCDQDSLDAELPFEPWGTIDAKVVDSRMAKEMSFAARWGSGCGMPFDAGHFLRAHPQFEWTEGILRSWGSYPWTIVKSVPKR